MRFLRAYIQRVLAHSIRCVIHRQTLDKSTLHEYVEDGYHVFDYWLDDPQYGYDYNLRTGGVIKATLGLKNRPNLYERTLSLLESDVLVTVEGDQIVDIEPVKKVPAYCCVCHKLKLPSFYGGVQNMQIAQEQQKLVLKDSKGDQHIRFVNVTKTPCKECLKLVHAE